MCVCVCVCVCMHYCCENRSVVSHSLQPHGLYSPWNSPGQNTGVSPFPSPGDLPNPGIKPRPPTLQADSLPAEPQVKSKNTGVSSISLLQWVFLIQGSNWGLLHCKWIKYLLFNPYRKCLPALVCICIHVEFACC